MAARDGLGDDLRGAGVGFKGKERVVRAGAAAPNAEALLAYQRADLLAVEVIGISRSRGDVKANIHGEPGHAVHGDVGDGFVPADLVVEFGAQAEGNGGGVDGVGFFRRLVETGEIRPNQHQLACAEVSAVGNRLLFGGADGARIDKAAYFLGDVHQLGRNRLAVQPRCAEDARHDAQFGIGSEQRLRAAVAAVLKRADGLGVLVGAVVVLFFRGRHADDDGQGVGLLVDGRQRRGERAFRTRLADGFGQVADEDGAVFRECGRVGVFASGDQPDHRSRGGAQWAAAVVDFDDANAMQIFGTHFVLTP